MCKPIDYTNKKYNILKLLHKMSVERYRHVMQEIPSQLCISVNTWRRWVYMDQDESYNIPQLKLQELSQVLGVSMEELKNNTKSKIQSK